MSTEVDLARAAEVLGSARSVVIGAHVDPDGDAVGSVLGLLHILDEAGISAVPVLPTAAGLPGTYAFLPGADRFRHTAGVEPPEVFVALDSPSPQRLADGEALARSASTLVMIDHHPDADADADGAITVFDPSAAATGCLVWRLAEHLGVAPDADAATCLYTAVLTDTGRFSYSNTDASTFLLAARMVDAGAHPNDIYSAVYENRSAGAQALLARALGRITPANGGRVAYAWVTDADFVETGALPSEGENLIDHVRALGGVDAVFLVKLSGPTARINLRAKGPTDVGSIARALGGGGHRAAAGATIDGDLEAALSLLLPLLPGGGA
ncbi:MAG: DHH family phosphoesterase [Coriobacteriia bacterium]|nr:DHH family phosphoesterase [Coriobacteriia bacterium]MBN2840042.1 DHH family phosphoesterase [Coriobacteriia bacterium]